MAKWLGSVNQRQFGPAHLASARSQASSGAPLQVVERPNDPAYRAKLKDIVGLYVDPLIMLLSS
jgi:hypothetical protein